MSSTRFLVPLAVSFTVLALAPLPTSHAAVGAMLSQVPQGEISCATAQAHWTNDADYQNKVAQAQALAAFDERGNQILAALSRVDAAAESCGLKGTVGQSSGESDSLDSTDAESSEAPVGSKPSGTSGSAEAGNPSTPRNGASNDSGSGGTADAPTTDAQAILGPIQSETSTPMKTIEVLGHGSVEVPDAEAMLENYLRQLTIVV
ncbi:hypothetical protein [Corynebacterium crudilactis]|uniref:Secreted protein n=1 Tax=Corynebacterium crudilactis TaxID=1652495 RepID=A0A172QQ87_9CORY|nr:hypothetical protein [Corynebacterium crudilactis]ANE02838.1 hypothetical protein ccrud_00400 [Corynebacterium crudilactis]